jgi:hypothetical protein
VSAPAPTAPVIAEISPANPAAGANVTIGVSGSNFVAGLNVLITGPLGPLPVNGSQIQNVNAFGFVLQNLPLTVMGSYSMQVINPGGVSSNVFQFSVH